MKGGANDRGGVVAGDHLAAVRFNDSHREGFVKDHFHRNVGDAHDYDLVVNTSRFSIEQSARLIVDALRQIESSTAGPGFSQA